MIRPFALPTAVHLQFGDPVDVEYVLEREVERRPLFAVKEP